MDALIGDRWRICSSRRMSDINPILYLWQVWKSNKLNLVYIRLLLKLAENKVKKYKWVTGTLEYNRCNPCYYTYYIMRNWLLELKTFWGIINCYMFSIQEPDTVLMPFSIPVTVCACRSWSYRWSDMRMTWLISLQFISEAAECMLIICTESLKLLFSLYWKPASTSDTPMMQTVIRR